ncbi:MAG: hypothetical protein ACYDFT_08475, partial [Thermoplasmata archaeon]
DAAEFDQGVADAEAKKEALGSAVDVPVGTDTAEFDASAAEVEATKEAVSTAASVPIDADTAGFDVGAAAVEVEKEILSSPVTVDVSIDEAQVAAEAAAARAIVSEISTGQPMSLIGTTPSIAEQLSMAGITQADLASGLTVGGQDATWLADSLLPSPQAIGDAFARRIEEGVYALTTIAQDPQSTLYQVLGGERTLLGAPVRAVSSSGEQLALGSGLGTIARDATGAQLALPAAGTTGLGGSFLSTGVRDATIGLEDLARVLDLGARDTSGGLSGFVDALKAAKVSATAAERALGLVGVSGADAKSQLSGAGYDPLSSLARLLVAQKGVTGRQSAGILSELGLTSSEANKLVSDAKGFKGLWGMLDKAFSGFGGSGTTSFLAQASSGFSKLSTSLSTPAFSLGVPAAMLGVPIAGALGLAAGGALAGTAIGGAGAAFALLPGLLDLYHGYTAYSNQQSGKANKGVLASAGTQAIAGGIRNLVGTGSAVFGSLGAQANPLILRFLSSLADALKTMAPFAQTAFNAMAGFFNVIDNGLRSGGFVHFMSIMTKDVGPIMKDFGQTILNLGGAFGHFLTLFGGRPAQMVGTWFTTETKKLEGFMAHLRFGHGFLAGAHTVFTALGAIVTTLYDTFKKVGDALAPIGLNLLKMVVPAMQGLAIVINAIPPNVLTALAVAFGIFWLALNPGAAVVLGILAVAAAIGILHNVIGKHTLAPLSNLQIVGAANAIHGGAGRTPGNVQDLQLAYDHGLTNQQIQKAAPGAWASLAPRPPGLIGPVARGFPGGGPTLAQQGALAVAKTTANPHAWGGPTSFYGKHLLPIGRDLENFFTKSIPNAMNHFKNFWIEWWGLIEKAGVKAWQFLDKEVIHPIVRFFVVDIPGAFGATERFFIGLWGFLEKEGVKAWHILYNNVIAPLIRFFTVDIPGAFGAVERFFIRLWGTLEKWGIAGWHWIYGTVLAPLVNFFTKTIPAGFDTAVNWFKGLPGRIAHALGSGLSTLWHWGINL